MLEERSQEDEIMDDLSISGEVVDQTLKELNTINRTLGGNAISLALFKKKVKNHDRVADLGCGGGDIMIDMAKYGRLHSLDLSFTGIDANPNIIRYAESNTAPFPEISYLSIDILGEEFKKLEFDIIHCCLFLHHFSTEQLVSLFSQFRGQASNCVIVNDLHRNIIAYWSIKWLTALFSRSSMVKNDAALSVARGFKKSELIDILEKAGITDYKLKWKWAFRWQLVF
ncbi:MAG: methyltransferase domain-containing protein [Bacteroidota bacterium]